MGFEGPSSHRWTAMPAGEFEIDATTVHGGHGAARLVRTAKTAGEFSAISDSIAVDFTGEVIELHGFLRTDGVKGAAALWLREDSNDGVVQFTNGEAENLAGTNGWAEHTLRLPLDPTATKVIWGVLLSGEGTVWADDMRVVVDDKPIWDAPYAPHVPAPAELDHDFDGGSGITLAALAPIQIANLAVLGRVWGFLKYHHPKVTAGQVQWDYALFRVLPKILAATDRASAEAALLAWIDGLGPVAACQPCATLDEHDLALAPALAWLDDRSTIGEALGAKLHAIHAARPSGPQYYVGLARGVGNPTFTHEEAYPTVKLPDPGFQLLAWFRLWNAIAYWAPNRALADRWDDQLAAFIPRAMLADGTKAYTLAMMAAIAKVADTHANLWGSLDERPPVGSCELAVELRFVGKRAVVVTGDASKQLVPGDVITSLDGTPLDTLIAAWTPYYADSNEAARLRDIAEAMTRGACGPIPLKRDRRGVKQRLELARTPRVERTAIHTHDLPGPTFRLLAPEVAYLKLSSVKADEVARQIEQAAGTKGLVIDIRNYPSEFVVFALGTLLVDKPSPFVRFTIGDLANPGAFHWSEPLSLEPAAPHYGGKVVVLVDEISQSQAEYTTMAFRSSPRTVVIGSTTAGADGNVSRVALPGGLHTMISGIGVFYPDKRPTQQIGIVPDRVVVPTIEGLRAGRDEVLEAGLREILGKATPAAKLQQIVAAARAQP